MDENKLSKNAHNRLPWSGADAARPAGSSRATGTEGAGCSERGAPAHSSCDYCGGVFNRNPWARERLSRCETCGAGKHWECRSTGGDSRLAIRINKQTDSAACGTPPCWYRVNGKPHKRPKWLVPEVEWELGAVEISAAIVAGLGILDVDGSFIPATDLLAARQSYGRSRIDSEEWREHGEGERRLDDWPYWVRQNRHNVAELQERRFWAGVLAASNGGVEDWRKPGETRDTKLEGYFYARENEARKEAVMDALDADRPAGEIVEDYGVSLSTVKNYNRERKSQMQLAQQDRIEQKLDELIARQADVMRDVRETVVRLRDRFPNNAEIELAVDRFITDVFQH